MQGQEAVPFPTSLPLGVSFCTALTTEGGGREGRKRGASGERDQATQGDAGCRESQEKPGGSRHRRRKQFKQTWGLREK